MPPLDRPYGTLAMAYAATGNVDVAKQLVAEYEQTPEADHSIDAERWTHGARGVIALVEDRYDDAVRHFRNLDDGNPCATCADPWIGRTYERAGKPDSAEVHYRRFVDTPSSELWYDNAHLAHALRTLGRHYEQRGDFASARAVYSRLAALYPNAEPAFRPIYDEAMAAINRLDKQDG
jgi:tetratricopeptide (TPR) repeat protein